MCITLFLYLSPFVLFLLACVRACVCVYKIQHMILTIVIDSILIRDLIFIGLILVSCKVASFHNKVHTFLYQKRLSEILVNNQAAFIFRYIFDLGLKDNHYVIHVVLLDNQNHLRELFLLNYCWYIYSNQTL